MERDSQIDHATLRAVLDAAQGGDHGRAAAIAERALADGLQHPLLFNVAALKLEQSGRILEAESLLRRAVRMAPGDRGSVNALGLCLMRLERPAEALEQFNALLRLDSALAFAHVSRGNSLRALGAVADAEMSYERGLALDPQQGMAWAGLAQIASQRGDSREARRCAEKALALVPGFPDAVMSLATAELGEGRPLEAEARIRELLHDGRLTPLERAYANGLLGDVLDAQNRPDDAFAAYTACNEALRQIYADRFSAAAALDYVSSVTTRIARLASPTWMAGDALGQAGPAGGHVFLLGFPRSGTTLLEVILEGHPEVVSLEEKESLIDAVRQFMRRPEDLDRLARAPPETLESLRQAYWRRVAEAGAEVAGKIFVDKHPLNTLKLPLIAKLFPRAKILFACRDPRDIVLSCFRHRFQMSAPIFSLLSIEGAARYYVAVMQLLIGLTGSLPLDICLVRHEDVVTEFAREMKRVCGFLGIEWAPGMGDFALRTQKRGVLTPSTAQLVKGLSTEGLGQWRRYRRQMDAVLPLLDPWVKRFYYEA
ncbi:MAG: sulfotransferase [Steroidobacteraceae bacterium]